MSWIKKLRGRVRRYRSVEQFPDRAVLFSQREEHVARGEALLERISEMKKEVLERQASLAEAPQLSRASLVAHGNTQP